jgi:iron complex outermembrane recepter protein
MFKRKAVYSAVTAALLGLSVVAQSSEFVLEELVVTAQKRAQNLVDVPASVQAMSGESLEDAGVQAFGDLVEVSPSLALQDGLSSWQKSIYVRGVGTNVSSATVEPSVSAVLDGVVLARQGQFFADLADIERIEVLRGPQSTLFGKNASAGVLNIVTKRPSLIEEEGSIELGLDEFEELRVKGTYSSPINDEMAYRLSTNYKHTDESHLENVNPNGPTLDKSEAYAVRGKLLWEISDELDALFIADYSHDDSPSGVRVWSGSGSPTDTAIFQQGASKTITLDEGNREVSLSDKNGSSSQDWGLSAEINWDQGDHTLTSITAYRSWTLDDNVDVDSNGLDVPALSLAPNLGGATPYFRGVFSGERESTQFSQEFRLQSNGAEDLQYILGAFIWLSNYEEDVSQRREFCFGGGPLLAQEGVPCDQVIPVILPGPVTLSPTYLATSASSKANVDTEYYALFGQADYNLNEDVILTLGLRLQHETFEFEQEQLGVVQETDVPFVGFEGEGKETNTKVTGKAGIQYVLNEDANVYFSYSRGYKGPGLNAGPFQPVSLEALDVETVDSFELGYKARLMDGRLSINSALFWQEFQDTQVLSFNAAEASFEADNAGETRQRGLELETFFAATEYLQLNASVTYLDAEYLEYSTNCYTNDTNAQCAIDGSKDVSGESTTYSPEWKTVVGGRYVRDIPGTNLDGFLQLSYRWQSEAQYDPNQDPLTLQDSYGIADLSFGVEDQDGRYKVSFYVKNLADKHYATNLAAFTSSSSSEASVVQFVPKSAERYFGASIKVNF